MPASSRTASRPTTGTRSGLGGSARVAARPTPRSRGQETDPVRAALLAPKNSVMRAVEKALLRGDGAHASPPIAEQIASRLAGLIALDLLRPGQRLLEIELSDVLQVSRSPVREAIRILERDHLVQLHARRGATVTAPEALDLQEIFELRTVLFAILLEQVMQDRPADLATVFEVHLPRLESAARESTEAYAVENFLLNLAITDLCSNRLVVDQLKAMSLRTLRYIRLGFAVTPEAMQRSIKGWRAFQAAVTKRDTPLVIELAAKRIRSIRDLAVTAVRKSQDGAALDR